tara:strand:+ start:390 stop:899 length:510 start_codon:yes stop_codon:yes gene_type:complete
MRFLIIFIFLISNSVADETIEIKNLVIYDKLKKYDAITFLNTKNDELNLDDYKGNLVLLNFWATWCAPCKEEMPSLDQLQSNEKLNNLKIFPINIGQENLKKSQKFFKDLSIKNLEVYFISSINLPKKLQLRGIPTTILINKDGLEFARIIGSVDFKDEKFIKWLNKYN